MRISNLSNKSGNPSSGDYLVLDDGTTVTKIDYNKLAKAIIENYAGSTVAGAAQSVKAALDSLNSKTGGQYEDTQGSNPSEVCLSKFNAVVSKGIGIYLISGGWKSTDFGFSIIWVQGSTRGIVVFITSNVIYHAFINANAITSIRKLTSSAA